MEDEVEIRKVQGLELILKSINCEKYKSKFENRGINEHTFILLTADDLRYLDVDNKDIYTILTAINVLNKTLNNSEVRLSNDEILNLQSKICGQLGYIALVLNHIHCYITSDKSNLNDMLIDNHISAIDAALMLKPYMRAEEKSIENTLKNVFKITTRSKTIMITTTMCLALVFGLTFRRLNYSFNLKSIF
uniref:SAM domain-containing protein n=1 Tax=Schizaphis graminum TaxID=13262 RepID=A0A2S2NTT3_SCHGA